MMDSLTVSAGTVAATVAVGAVAAALVGWGPRRTVVKLLDAYRRVNLAVLRARGLTPANVVERRVVSGQAWEEWTEAIRAAGAALTSGGCPTDPFNQAEGYRYLSRLVRASLESFMECSDPNAPRLVALANGLRDCPVKLGADNPDNLYENANIDGREVYRVYGKRGTVNYLGFGTQSGMYGGEGGLQTVMYKEASTDFDIKPDGSFELILSAEPPANGDERNWLQLRKVPTSRAMLIVRQTFLDRKNEVPASVKIERISGPHRPSQLTCEQVDDALKTSAMFVAGASFMFANWCKGFQAHTNQLPLFDQETSNKAGGDPQIRYYHSYWRVQPDEALLIEAVPPPCLHWNFQLNNHWMESLDYRFFTIHVNKHTANVRASDKSVRVVVAHEDPKLSEPYNWIDAVGHTQGQMLWRWVRVDPAFDGANLPHPRARLVKLAELRQMKL